MVLFLRSGVLGQEPLTRGASDGRQRYTSSKLANMWCTYALAARLALLYRSGEDSRGIDPGLMLGTDLGESGQALAWVATSEDLAKRAGVYFEGKKEIRSSKTSYDEARQRDIWEWTIENISLDQEHKSMLHQM